jgi:penicillin-binding protein 1B
LLPVALAFAFWGTLLVGAWCVWVGYEAREDFRALQWALPGRIYARPLELYAGARVSQEQTRDYLRQLGYRETSQPSGPGEFASEAGRLRIHTRGFTFWDGTEPARYIDASFAPGQVLSLRERNGNELLLARLDPVEIAQINPETGEDRLPLRREDTPQALIDALIAVEDQRFYSHHGVDPLGIARALVTNLLRGQIAQGGSTLTQQLVKNLYLSRERTLRRKIEEAVMAVALELSFSKEEILNAYLNEVYLGQDGARAIHGFALGAQHYFARPLQELELQELALLAGLPRGASYYNPFRHPERARNRRDVVLARMLDQGYISAEAAQAARKAELVVRQGTSPARSGGGYPAFLELVYSDLARDYDREALRTEGLRIFTTLDIHAQAQLEATLDKAVAAVERKTRGEPAPLEAAMVITDTGTGEVLALAGSRKPGYTGFNRALKAVRPIGSLVKPAVYLAALETRDFHLASVLADAPVSLKLPNGDVWQPQNYDRTSEGDVYLYDALQRSLNLATVDLGMRLGLHKVASMLERLGHTRPVQPYPSLLLGAVEMAPIEVAQLYQTIASNGFRSRLRSVQAVTSASGTPLEYYSIRSEQVVDAASVYLLEHALQGTWENGTARNEAGRMRHNLPLAGKTGTTNDLRDSWFAGYGENMVGVVWLGYDDNRESGLTGATGALKVWAEVMSRLNIQPRQTLAPAGIRQEQVPRTAVRDPARRDCNYTQQLPFRADTLPEVGWSCEVSDSFFERVMDRFRN